jgi:hypothetical protein
MNDAPTLEQFDGRRIVCVKPHIHAELEFVECDKQRRGQNNVAKTRREVDKCG